MRHLVLSLVAAAALTPAAAFAVEVNFSNVGANLNMGSIAAGQFGTISYNNPGAPIHMTGGDLAAKSQIVFSYTFNGPLANWSNSYTTADYSYTQGGDLYEGNAVSNVYTPPLMFLNSESATGTVNGSPSTPLVLATANLVKGNNTASWTVTNDSFGIASFFNTLTLLFAANPDISSLTYNVSSLATPLPAALPMFGSLIAGMFGVRRMRRKAVAA